MNEYYSIYLALMALPQTAIISEAAERAFDDFINESPDDEVFAFHDSANIRGWPLRSRLALTEAELATDVNATDAATLWAQRPVHSVTYGGATISVPGEIGDGMFIVRTKTEWTVSRKGSTVGFGDHPQDALDGAVLRVDCAPTHTEVAKALKMPTGSTWRQIMEHLRSLT